MLHKHTSIALFVFSVSLASILTACDRPAGSLASGSQPVLDSVKSYRKAPVRIDLGLIFADEESYVCFPLEKLGIDGRKEIVEVKSSCSCVKPTIVHVLYGESEKRGAIRFDFVREPKTANQRNPISLGVQVEVMFANGSSNSVYLDFLLLNVEFGKSLFSPAFQVRS